MNVPDLGILLTGTEIVFRIPRRYSFQANAAACSAERQEIAEWCAEQGIVVLQIDMAVDRTHDFRLRRLEWALAVTSESAAIAVKLRFS